MTLVRVMIVDDDEPFRRAISRAMRGRGYAVEEAEDGAEALRAVKIAAPDVLVTDLLMPASDGVELIGALKGVAPDLPIIAMSGRPSMGGLDLLGLARALGARTALLKPFSTDDLVEAVAAICPQEDAA